MIQLLKANKLTIRLFLAGSLLMLMAGCKDFLNVNQNPNASNTPSLSGLLSSAEYATANNSYDAASVTTYYVQQLASPSGSSIDRQHEVYLDGTWASLYNTMTDLKDLDSLAQQKGAPQYAAAAKILLAMNLGETTDLWGDIPYSQAFKGQTNLTPTYDSQKDIYSDIQNLLDSAISEIQQGGSTGAAPNSDDYYYGGDMKKWLETAYALKARYLNHLSKKSSYNPQAVLSAAGKAYQSNADDAQLTYTSANRNPWATVVLNNSTGTLGGFLSQYLIRAMTDSSHLADSTAQSIYGVYDPRLTVMTDTLAGGKYNGTVNGKGSPNTPYNYLTQDSWFGQDNSPIPLVTYSEVKFIEAEAAFRNDDKPAAYQAYLDGIKANMDKLGIPAAEETAYLTNPKVAVGANNLTLELIFKEKLVALFLQPEAWTDARRFNYQYKDMTVPYMQYSALNGKFIRRILYPQSEQTRNAKNLPTVSLTTPMWWDQAGQ